MNKKKWYIVSELNRYGDYIVHDYPENVRVPSCGGKYMSISVAGDTEEELKRKNEVPDWSCSKCGNVVKLLYNNKKELEEHKMCFHCNFWREIIKSKHNKVIIDGECYHVYPDNPNAMFKGHGGRSFKIKMRESGEIINTKNLWGNGKIPKMFKNELPDNAEFIQG